LIQIKVASGNHRILGQQEATMPLHDAIIVGGIVSAFTTFGIILAWGASQTRNPGRKTTETVTPEEIKKAA